MAAVTMQSFGTVEVFSSLTAYDLLDVEPVGAQYKKFCLARVNSHSLGIEADSEEQEEDSAVEVVIEDDITFLRTLCPKEWKKQDHYKVLGLSKLRYKATEDDIKKAYRQKVLRHHPDKRRGAGEEIRDEDDYFTCITRAYETLGVPAKRISYDSVDPLFDEEIPDGKVSKEKFFKVYRPVFERNARWSTRRPVPELGNSKSSRDDVEHFYSFWYDFDSWREFSYLDEEEKEKGENRDERRFIERQNKAARKDRKKAETARLRQLVDNAYAADPRIQRFKEEDRDKKAAQKQRKQEERQRRLEEEERALKLAEEEAQRRREAEEAARREEQETARRQKEAARQALARGRQALRQLCAEKDYFAESDAERADHMMELERMCTVLDALRLDQLNEQLSQPTGGRERFLEEVDHVKKQVEQERISGDTVATKTTANGGKAKTKAWSHDELQMLIKAVKLFPAGTNQRWEVIASFINQHVSGSKRTAKEVLAHAKDLQKSDQKLKQSANQNAYENFEKSTKAAGKIDDTGISERTETPLDQQGSNQAPWTPEEQKRLEQALKTYGPQTKDRWDRIAECLPNRTRKDCMRRYKELVELIKAKKAAQAAVSDKA
ncbi:dnaJ homolog subfamily C member 2-like [Amphibalanus amphitrite]|uniref:dnaJ homolog subfamily C member 2-like n=1 Tax=Amphibalanus amphitrite TaxID=1232801 RepID=UPI001C903594|nr:dnaJ homolog subfamily C member 2-like [Amphibalanus amphitrite]